MDVMYSTQVFTPHGIKRIDVFCGDFAEFDEEIDILTVSSYRSDYAPHPGTMMEALSHKGILVEALAERPEVDLRNLCRVWLSEEIADARSNVRRIGCVERGLSFRDRKEKTGQQGFLNHIKAYFRMLDLAAIGDIPMKTVAMPLLGTGSQQISADLVLIPLVSECIDFLKRNAEVERICFIEKSPSHAYKMARTLETMYALKASAPCQPSETAVGDPPRRVFISYTTPDKAFADAVCEKLESKGMKVWYAPRDVSGNDYATSIVDAILHSTHFVALISENSMNSQHMLNEIALAFERLRYGIHFHPVRFDEAEMIPAYAYYLLRQHWIDAHTPPLDVRLEEFAERLLNE
ncbi:MAG: toll/interleukin-1 receptor domain-containing protein [Clostridia bacterium]|nr:toll/interleukin-1 receptor domain-containing protein [Clostridia bacterium]